MIRRLYRVLARWHHRQNVRDLDYTIRYHEAQLRGLPGEIKRLGQIRREHVGRLATLTERRDPVNFRLGRARSRSTPS